MIVTSLFSNRVMVEGFELKWEWLNGERFQNKMRRVKQFSNGDDKKWHMSDLTGTFIPCG